jgi:hypothetical protein
MVPDEHESDTVVGEPPPERTREFLMEHLARFYDFKGLFRWKRRFDPAFEDRYLVYPAALALPRVALALIRAQSPAGLMSYLPWAHRPSGTPERGAEASGEPAGAREEPADTASPRTPEPA